MQILLDLLTVIVILAGISINAKRGLVKSVLIIVSAIASIWLAGSIAGRYSKPLYERFFEKQIEKSISNEVSDFDCVELINKELFKEKLGITVSDEEIRKALLKDGKIEDNLIDLCENNTSSLDRNQVLEYIDKKQLFVDSKYLKVIPDDESFEQTVRILANPDKKARSKAFYSEIAKPYILVASRWIVALLAFVIASSVLSFIISRINILDKIPIAGLLNTILGGVLGAIEGFIVIAVMALMIKILGAIFGFNLQTNDTIIFKAIYNIF